MIKTRRSHRSEGEHSGDHHLERWLLTYADMITLLTAFFLMLYSMSVMSRGKFQQVALSVRSGFGGTLTDGRGILMNARSSVPQTGVMSDTAYTRYQDAMRELSRFVEQHKLGGQVRVHNELRGVVITLLSDGLLFERGQAALRPVSESLLAHVAQVLNTLPNEIQVEGHTCDLPIHTAQFPSNWELSTARAGRVVHYLTQQAHISARRLVAAGYADTRPIAPNDTEAHRARNRRVEIVILKTEEQRQADLLRQNEIQRITVQHNPDDVTQAANEHNQPESGNPANGTADTQAAAAERAANQPADQNPNGTTAEP